ncbi:universal stress protein [Saccharomonospora sp. NPDC046836]|uniref:universal stress protein n=1 Tax=Saccharomonospora sp. NPDC046836 TaxID=3156921 RepID=UPI0033D7B2CB
MNVVVFVVFVAAWLLVGLGTGLWLAHRGFDPKWTAIAVALGPLFVPIAFERAAERPRRTAPRRGTAHQAAGGTRVLVGVDGSADSEQALDTVLRLLGSRCVEVLVAEVVPYDATDDSAHELIDAAAQRLARTAALVADVPVRRAVLAGPPAEALSRFAEEEGVDLLVVARGGRGLSHRLPGRVAEDLVRHARVPVLVVEPL